MNSAEERRVMDRTASG
jgi:hypothetical protein